VTVDMAPSKQDKAKKGLRLGADFLPRVISAAILAPIVIADLLVGGGPFLALLVLAGLLGGYEWARMTLGSPWIPAAMVTMLGVSGALAFGWLVSPFGALMFVFLAAALAWAFTPAFLGRQKRFQGLGVLYLGLPLLATLWLRMQEDGFALILWLLVAVWATDVGAYFAGRLIGGPKLAPRWSPKKTWSGLLGGAIASAIGSYAVMLGWPIVPPVVAGALGLGLAVVAQAGDLFESAIKRHFGVKDSGTLIPGHGGLLDRIDGLLFAAPALALVAVWIHGT
jgi:phosphatidate cytidylyltransferase